MTKYKFNTFEGLRGFSSGLREVKVIEEHSHTVNKEFYQSKEWARLRAKIRKKINHCELCGAQDTLLICDHIVEIKDGGAKLDEKNIQVLCNTCHNNKTYDKKVIRTWLKTKAEIEAVLDRGIQGRDKPPGGTSGS